MKKKKKQKTRRRRIGRRNITGRRKRAITRTEGRQTDGNKDRGRGTKARKRQKYEKNSAEEEEERGAEVFVRVNLGRGLVCLPSWCLTAAGMLSFPKQFPQFSGCSLSYVTFVSAQ